MHDPLTPSASLLTYYRALPREIKLAEDNAKMAQGKWQFVIMRVPPNDSGLA